MTNIADYLRAEIHDERLNSGISEYIRLWNCGLKKQANRSISAAMRYFDTLSDKEQKRFTEDFCRAAEQAEGRVDITHELSKRLRIILEQCTHNGEMPHARWYCRLYLYGFASIGEIYRAHEDDRAIAEMYFSAVLGELCFGAHHFPEGCCIDNAEYALLIAQGAHLIEKHGFPEEAYLYYKTLYEAYYSWDRKTDFTEYCKQCGLTFEMTAAYYYG